MVSSSNITSLSSAIGQFDVIEVADYQRNFSWKAEQISELWSDISALGNGDDSHFLGSLILQKDPNNPKRSEIVDGQQRITTIFLIMARLRDEVRRLSSQIIPATTASERDIPVLAEIENFLYVGRTTDCKYKPNLLITSYFKEAMTPESGSPVVPRSSDLIPKRDRSLNRGITLDFRNGYWQIKKLIEDEMGGFASDLEKLSKIKEITDILVTRLSVLPIETGDTGESLNVFMTINDRGLPLGVFDLVRGYILSATTAGMTDVQKIAKFRHVHQEWENILKNIAGSDPDKFLRHFFLSIQSKKVTTRNISAVALELIGDLSTGETSSQNAENLWTKVQVASSVYSDLKNPPAGKSQTQLHALNIIADSYRVLLLRVLQPSYALTVRSQEEIIDLVYRVALGWPILGGNAQTLESEFQRICLKLNSMHDVPYVKSELAALIPANVDAAQYFAEGVSGTWAKALLLSIEDALSGRAIPLSPDNFEIEHIAPQTSTTGWESALGLRGDDYKDAIERPGNLTLLDGPINRQIKQRPFKDSSGIDKSTEYAVSRSNLSSDLSRISVWNTSMIDKRSGWFIVQVNRLLNASTPVEAFTTWLAANP